MAPRVPWQACLSFPLSVIAGSSARATATAPLKAPLPTNGWWDTLRALSRIVPAKRAFIEMLFRVPNYDFNWQINRYFLIPKPLPREIRLEVTGTWEIPPTIASIRILLSESIGAIRAGRKCSSASRCCRSIQTSILTSYFRRRKKRNNGLR